MGRFIALACLAAVLLQCQATTLFEEEVRIADEILGKNPQNNLKYIRPPGEPTNVTVNMYVRNILDICEEHHVWKVQLSFRQEWTDSRLAYTSTNADLKYIPYGNIKEIWHPDLFFTNEIESTHHETLTPNDLLRISPDGHVLYSTRITVKLFCPTDFKKKEIHCPVRIASYGFTQEEVHVEWKAENPVQVNPNLFTPDYTFNGVTTNTCESTTSTGTYSCINADFVLGHSVCVA